MDTERYFRENLIRYLNLANARFFNAVYWVRKSFQTNPPIKTHFIVGGERIFFTTLDIVFIIISEQQLINK